MELTNIHPAEAYLRNEQNPLPRENASVATSLQTGTTSKKSTPPHRIMKRIGTGNYSLNTSGSHALPRIPTTGSGKLP